MFRIDDPSAAAALPTPEAAGTEGYWTEGNPGASVAATLARASFLNMIQEELRAIVTAAGLTPSKVIYNQVLTAIQTLMQRASPQVGIDTGAANAAVVNYTPAITSRTDGMVLWFKAAAANTGATTLNVNGLGASPVVGGAHSALQGGEIILNGKCQVVWNATLSSWVLIECTGGTLQIAAGTQSGQAVNQGQFVNSIAASGYQKLPSGLIVQWGSVSNTASATSTGTFPLAFPTASLSVVLTGLNASGGLQAYGVVNSHSTTGFAWNAFFAASGSAPALSASSGQVLGRYIAIGN